MVDIHDKLTRGVKVDQQVVSLLVLGGIMNITAQHDGLEEIDVKMKELEHENITNKSRLESLENWVLNHYKLINHLREQLERFDESGTTLKESKAVEELQKRITSLEMNSKQARVPQTERTVEEPKKKPSSKSKKCDVCRKEFLRNCDLEHHLVEHNKTKQF